jgi:glycosyltransferase involved in cell wall biosynthesis
MPADGAGLVSVIVTTRNSERTLEACLRSVRSQTHPRIELVVVDNHSTDATMEIASRYADRVATVGPERSAQRNHGAALASGDHLLFVDSDMVLDDDVVTDGLEALRGADLPAVVIPERTEGEGFWTNCRILERSCYTGDDTVEAARLFTRASFVEIGGFDPDLNGGEDWDLSRRVAAGRRLPRTRAVIRHDEGRTTLRTVYAKRRYYAPGYLRYLRKHGSDVLAQGNPIIRAAYLRHWRRLARHPLLTTGMVSLKVIETTAVLQVAVGEKLRAGPARPRISHLYGPSAARTASRECRPVLVTFGSILEPDGGLAVRSRVLAESLSILGSPASIVSTRERTPSAAPAWARKLLVPARKPWRGFSRDLVRLIQQAASDADVVIVANAMFMPALTLSRVRLPMVWDTNECQTLHYRRLPRTPANRAKGLLWLWLERWAARRCRLAVAISGAEAAEWPRIHPRLQGKVVTVDHSAFASPRSVDASRAKLSRHLGGATPGPVLVFVGTMTAKHNSAAARWILDVLGPSLPATTTVVICGRGSDRLTSAGPGARVVCLGPVIDIDSIIAAADLCLAPLAAGAGVKTKVLHYLAHGRRVAGTPVAFEGLAGAPGLYESELDALPDLVTRVIADVETEDQARIRSAGQLAWMAGHHGLEHVAEQWNEVLTSLAAC